MVSSCVYKKCNNGLFRFVCLVYVCPPFFMRGTEAKLQTLILQKNTHQQEDAENHLSDKTYSTPNKQNPNSHLLSLPTTKMSTKLHNSVTKSSLFFSLDSRPVFLVLPALSLSLSLLSSLPPSLPPCGKLQTLIALRLVFRVLASVGRLSERERGERPRTITGGSLRGALKLHCYIYC